MYIHIKRKRNFTAHSFSTKHTFRKKEKSMSNKGTSSLLTLPVELVYRVLDNLDELTILLSVRDVCTRLNSITDKYHRYQVNI